MNNPTDDTPKKDPESQAGINSERGQKLIVRNILVVILAFTSGFIDALAFLRLGVFASVQTANKANKDPNNFKVILLTYHKIDDSKSQPTNEGQRFPLTGTIDQVGNDIQRIKQMGIDHIIFAYNFIPIGRDLNKVMEITKQLSKFAR